MYRGHPHEAQVRALLATVRAQVNELWSAVTAHAAERPPFEEDLKVTFYFGQMVTSVEGDDGASERSAPDGSTSKG